jgi:hypothetical protein
MIHFEKFTKALGYPENSFEFKEMTGMLNEQPKISEDPTEYNDPGGATKYYSFPVTGVLCGIKGGVLDHIHLYISVHEGYESYSAELFSGLNVLSSYDDVISMLGTPLKGGGGTVDSLIGYIYKWIRYVVKESRVRFELMENNRIRKITLSK